MMTRTRSKLTWGILCLSLWACESEEGPECVGDGCEVVQETAEAGSG